MAGAGAVDWWRKGTFEAQMSALIGKYVNKIDKKGRVSIPKPFRDAFAGQSFAGVFAYPSFKFPVIEASGEAFIERVAASLDDLDMFSDEQDDLAAVILENAHSLPFDPEGRVILPKDLVEHAGLSDEAVFVGRGTRFRIWAPAAYDRHRAEAFENARRRGATLTLRPGTGEPGGAS
jgi:MraZ protein